MKMKKITSGKHFLFMPKKPYFPVLGRWVGGGSILLIRCKYILRRIRGAK